MSKEHELAKYAEKIKRLVIDYYSTWHKPMPARKVLNVYAVGMRKQDITLPEIRKYLITHEIVKFIRTEFSLVELIIPGAKDLPLDVFEVQQLAGDFEYSRQENMIEKTLMKRKMLKQKI